MLSEYRVIEFSDYPAGSILGMHLADQGAEVIKVEPLAGEQMRHMAAPHNGVNPIFYSCNRGKKSLRKTVVSFIPNFNIPV